MASRDRGHSLFARHGLPCVAAPALSQRHLARFCVNRGKLSLFGSPRLLALGISGLFSVLTRGTDWIATAPAGDEAGHRRSLRRSSRLRRGRAKLRVLPLLKGHKWAALRVSACTRSAS